MTVGVKLFPAWSSLVLGSSSSVEAFKAPAACTLLLPATGGRVQREETLQAAMAADQLQEKEEEEEEGTAGLCT